MELGRALIQRAGSRTSNSKPAIFRPMLTRQRTLEARDRGFETCLRGTVVLTKERAQARNLKFSYNHMYSAKVGSRACVFIGTLNIYEINSSLNKSGHSRVIPDSHSAISLAISQLRRRSSGRKSSCGNKNWGKLRCVTSQLQIRREDCTM